MTADLIFEGLTLRPGVRRGCLSRVGTAGGGRLPMVGVASLVRRPWAFLLVRAPAASPDGGRVASVKGGARPRPHEPAARHGRVRDPVCGGRVPPGMSAGLQSGAARTV